MHVKQICPVAVSDKWPWVTIFLDRPPESSPLEQLSHHVCIARLCAACPQQPNASQCEPFSPGLYICASALVAATAVMVFTIHQLYGLSQLDLGVTGGQDGSHTTARPPRLWVAGNKVRRVMLTHWAGRGLDPL